MMGRQPQRAPARRPADRRRPGNSPSSMGTGYGQPPAGPRAQKPRLNRPTTINVLLIIITIAAGFITWMIGALLYWALKPDIPRPVLIGLEFALLFTVIAIIVLVFSVIGSLFEENIFTGDANVPIAAAAIALGAVVVFGLGAFFQWLYALDSSSTLTGPTSYIYIIDESGSMEVNDPEGKRYAAIEESLKDQPDDFPYMVYGFSDNCNIIRNMAPKSQGLGYNRIVNNGGTTIKGTLKQVFEDYKNNVWDGGAFPKVIFVTDGYATDLHFNFQINRIIKNYAKKNISISTVGLGDVDDGLLSNIAKTTGGVFIDISQASDLSDAITNAANQYDTDERDLINERHVAKLDVLYGFLRVLFVTILGALIGIAMIIPHGFSESYPLIILSSSVKAFIGALIMEIGIGVGGSQKFMWALLWIIIAVTITYKLARPKINQSSRKI